jgi:hypothetical protein
MVLLLATPAVGLSPPEFMVAGPIAGFAPRSERSVGIYYTLHGVLGERPRVPGQDRTHSVVYWKDHRSVLVDVEEVENPRWALHEIETHFREKAEQWHRRTADEKRRLPAYSFEIRPVLGQRIFFGADGEYVWTSGTNRVVRLGSARQVQLADGSLEIRELPDEFLTTYLTFLPSTLPDIRFTVAHEQAYIREEFERDFEYVAYYMGQWKAHGALPGRDEYAPVSGRLRHIRDQRSKYFGGDSTDDWERKLVRSIEHKKPEDQPAAYAQTATLAFWQAQYDELKGWWEQHRGDPINVEPIKTH